MKDLDQIDPAVGFKHFPLGLTPAANADLAALQVGPGGSYDNFGELDHVVADCQIFFSALGNENSGAIKAGNVVEFIRDRLLDGFNAQTGWLTIRATNPSNVFDQPRWHIDGYYYQPYTGDAYKAVTVLKGPGTLLSAVNDEQRKLLGSTDNQAFAEKVIGTKSTTATPTGHVTAFIVGSEHAAYHSEPSLKTQRIFLSFVPGTFDEIEQLRLRWACESKAAYRLYLERPQLFRQTTAPAARLPSP